MHFFRFCELSVRTHGAQNSPGEKAHHGLPAHQSRNTQRRNSPAGFHTNDHRFVAALRMRFSFSCAA